MKLFGLIKSGVAGVSSLWQHLNGETTYQSYLAHWRAQHAESGEPAMNRQAFFAAETQRKWNGIKRCC